MKILHFLIITTLCIITSCMQFSYADASVPLVMITIQGGANSPSCGNACITPQNITISKGTAVEWINNDLVPHSITSGISGQNDSGVFFNSGTIFAGKYFIHNFDDIGTFHYFDPNYTFDAGTIVVTESPIPTYLPVRIPINQTKSGTIAENNNQKQILDMTQSPLKQFKSGVAANDVICRPDMQLLIQDQENRPICVKLDHVSNLLHRDWSYPVNCNYAHDAFTAGVEGLVIIEKNAEDPASGKSYFPQNSTVVIGLNNTVSWINQDLVQSSVTSNWNLFDSGPILPEKEWKHTFECAGNYGYHSEPHPWMKGWIRVLPPSR